LEHIKNNNNNNNNNYYYYYYYVVVVVVVCRDVDVFGAGNVHLNNFYNML
jgi:hypothetical protein